MDEYNEKRLRGKGDGEYVMLSVAKFVGEESNEKDEQIEKRGIWVQRKEERR